MNHQLMLLERNTIYFLDWWKYWNTVILVCCITWGACTLSVENTASGLLEDGLFSTVWKMQHELFEHTASGLLEGWSVLYSMKGAAWAAWKYGLWSAREMVCSLQYKRCSMSCLKIRPLVCCITLLCCQEPSTESTPISSTSHDKYI
jgi:hypothetical protein